MSTKAQEENGRVFVIWCSFLVVYADEALWSVVGCLLRNLHHALQVDCVVAYVLSRMDYHGLRLFGMRMVVQEVAVLKRVWDEFYPDGRGLWEHERIRRLLESGLGRSNEEIRDIALRKYHSEALPVTCAMLERVANQFWHEAAPSTNEEMISRLSFLAANTQSNFAFRIGHFTLPAGSLARDHHVRLVDVSFTVVDRFNSVLVINPWESSRLKRLLAQGHQVVLCRFLVPTHKGIRVNAKVIPKASSYIVSRSDSTVEEISLLDRLIEHVLLANLELEPRSGHFFCAHRRTVSGEYERLYVSRSGSKKVFAVALAAAGGPPERASNKAGRVGSASSFRLAGADESATQSIGGWATKSGMGAYLRGGQRGAASLPSAASAGINFLVREARASFNSRTDHDALGKFLQ